MQKFARWIRRDQSGFTLIELLVVVTILALLGAVAIPRITAARNQAIARSEEANKGIIEAALEQYYILNDEYPAVPTGGVDAAFLGTTLDLANASKILDNFTVTYTLTGGVAEVTVVKIK